MSASVLVNYSSSAVSSNPVLYNIGLLNVASDNRLKLVEENVKFGGLNNTSLLINSPTGVPVGLSNATIISSDDMQHTRLNDIVIGKTATVVDRSGAPTSNFIIGDGLEAPVVVGANVVDYVVPIYYNGVKYLLHTTRVP